jgi:serine/threonine-protein kinase
VAALDRDRAVEQEELRATLARFRTGLTVGIAAWAVFGAVDWLAAHHVEPFSLGKALAFRAAGGGALLLVLAVCISRPPRTTHAVYHLGGLVLFLAGAAIGGVAALYRGLESPYLHGVSILLVGEGVLVAKPWRFGMLSAGSALLGYVGGLAAAALAYHLDIGVHRPQSTFSALQNAAFVLTTAVFTILGGHMVWALRRQVFESRTIGRYRLQARIGKGGMGEVWKAYHFALKRDVAVKILKPPPTDSGMAVARFDREVQALGELRHPNTVRVYDYGTTPDGLWYYVMELLSGCTLRELVDREGPLSPARAVALLAQVASAVAEAHSKGMVHRDLKPENIFVCPLPDGSEYAKVFDFGIARLGPDTNLTTLTRDGWVGGTPAYISPEVARGEAAGPPADVYGLGLTLYFALTGNIPFVAPNPLMMIQAHLHQAPLPPSEWLEEPLPPDLEGLVLTALEKRPSARFADAGALARAFDGLVALPMKAARRREDRAFPLVDPARAAAPELTATLAQSGDG